MIGGKRMTSGRASLALETGEAPVGGFVTRECGNVACVNPSHLLLGETSRQLPRAVIRAVGEDWEAGDENYSSLARKHGLSVDGVHSALGQYKSA